jgi:hypothetical protein
MGAVRAAEQVQEKIKDLSALPQHLVIFNESQRQPEATAAPEARRGIDAERADDVAEIGEGGESGPTD